jgi:rSAM/selenodomain-associated transferase 1
MQDALIIFIKNAELGKVKTRLAATLGDEQALDIYKKLLSLTQKITLQIDCQRYLYYSNFIDVNDDFSESDFTKRVQIGENLGERMSNAFTEVLTNHSKAVIIGSDCAELQGQVLSEAFAHLAAHDFVVGAAEDGGYYMLGMKEAQPEVFANIEWSTDEVFSKTIGNIKQLEKSVAFSSTLSDLDNEADWLKVKHLMI